MAEQTGDPVLIGAVHDLVIRSTRYSGDSPRRRKAAQPRWLSSETVRWRASISAARHQRFLGSGAIILVLLPALAINDRSGRSARFPLRASRWFLGLN